MTNQEYFNHLLFQQRLSDSELANLRSIRDDVQLLLSALAGSPRFYHAGSYGKRTIIRERYDLDMVIYWPSTTNYTLKAISDGVGEQLAKKYRYLIRSPQPRIPSDKIRPQAFSASISIGSQEDYGRQPSSEGIKSFSRRTGPGRYYGREGALAQAGPSPKYF